MLPVESIVSPLIEKLSVGNVILSAPPGAGKSTYLPIKLLDAVTGKIIMLQPRRVAVRAIAGYLAEQLGEEVGHTVGYRIRGESKVSNNTRIEIITEGLLTRKLQNDPELADVSLVIFDEFHERNLHADFSLALCLEAQAGLRDDLRLLVMSATLEVQALQALMPDAQSIQCDGRSYPVDILYRPPARGQALIDVCVSVISQALQEHDGNILVFLPGAWEIQRLEQLLTPGLSNDVVVAPLFGNLTKQQQALAIAAPPAGRRKVVLATNIAETSLTIDGITLVIDSGEEKVAQFNLARGITQLKRQRISRASSVQRAGRAGRLAAGTCYRMWPEDLQSRLREQRQPDMLHTDVSPFLLEAKVWGTDLEQLALIDVPSKAQLEHGYGLLQQLSALDTDHKLTAHGRKLAALGCHPRLANMLIQSQALSVKAQALACVLVALLESSEKTTSVRLSDEVEKLLRAPKSPQWRMARQWMKRLSVPIADQSLVGHLHYLPILLGQAFPDHIAMHRCDGRYQLSGGTGAELGREDSLFGEEFLAVGKLLLTEKANARITLAEPISREQLEQHFSHLIKRTVRCDWDPARQRIVSESRVQLGACVLNKAPAPLPQGEHLAELWCELIRTEGLTLLGWDESLQRWRRKLAQAAVLFPERFDALTDQQLLQSLEDWLGPYLYDVQNLRQLQGLDWSNIVRNQLDWQQQQSLEDLFPSHFVVPTGSKYKLRYDDNGEVTLAVKMQEVYGLAHTPTIAEGRVPIVFELLSPAGRPIQKTADLAGFWQGSYRDVQKEMKGRYPKHFWPDDPAVAQATRKTKKYM